MGRFVRGDRSRNTEGSGLGLSIAKSLTELQGGDFSLRVSEDRFAAIITFPQKESRRSLNYKQNGSYLKFL